MLRGLPDVIEEYISNSWSLQKKQMLISLANIEERGTEINLDKEEEKRQRKIDGYMSRK